MSRAIEVLRHEHEAILLALNILDRIADKAERSEVAAEDVGNFLGFLRDFADKCHHGKEEGLLFPAMIEAGLPAVSGPVAVMLMEHEQGRALVAAMSSASQTKIKPEAFSDAAKAYSAHLRAHIEKENNVLFPLAEELIPPAKLYPLYDAFEQYEEDVMGHGRHDQLHAMLKELKAKYLEQ